MCSWEYFATEWVPLNLKIVVLFSRQKLPHPHSICVTEASNTFLMYFKHAVTWCRSSVSRVTRVAVMSKICAIAYNPKLLMTQEFG